MKKITAVLLSVMLFCCGCATTESSVEPQSEMQSQVHIGICFDTFTVERWSKDRDVFTYTATNLGAKVDVQNANGDINKQREQITHLMDSGVDVLVIVAVDGEKLTDLLEKAHKKGIWIVAYDRMINNAPVDAYLSFDNEKVGKMMADAIVQKNGAGSRVLMIQGPQTDRNVSMVQAGFNEVARKNDMQVVGEFSVDGWRTEHVQEYFSENAEILNNVDAIMCGNDSIAGEVIKILAEKRLAGQIIVVGQDADVEACQHIVEGTQLMTVYKPVELLAQKAAELSYHLATETNPLVDIKDTINNGENEVPYVILTPIAVSKENMDEQIIDSGFHLEEDVYANVVRP